MGYYKKQSTLRGKMAKSSGAADAGGFIKVTINMETLARKLDRLEEYKKFKKQDIKDAHKNVARSGKRKMQKTITDYPTDIVVKRKGKDPLIVKKGTLRKSIGIITPKDERALLLWLGVRSRAAIGKNVRTRVHNDGWFAHIVQGGDNLFGAGVNKGFWEKAIRAALPTMRRNMENQHTKLLNKLNAEP